MSALPAHGDFSRALRSDAAQPPAFGAAPPRAGNWLRAPIWANRGLFGQVALAAVLINTLSLATFRWRSTTRSSPTLPQTP